MPLVRKTVCLSIAKISEGGENNPRCGPELSRIIKFIENLRVKIKNFKQYYVLCIKEAQKKLRWLERKLRPTKDNCFSLFLSDLIFK